MVLSSPKSFCKQQLLFHMINIIGTAVLDVGHAPGPAGPGKFFFGARRFKTLRTNFRKLQNKNPLFHNQTDLIDISSGFTCLRASQMEPLASQGVHRQKPLPKTFFCFH